MDISVVPKLSTIAAADWDALAGDDNPFVEHAFLAALEESKSVGKGTGWLPMHLVARDKGRVVAALPCYEKSDSYGEYIFDWSWARAVRGYYPKLTSAIPFVPATGPRLLVRPDAVDVEKARDALVKALVELTKERKASSAHVLFLRDDECAAFQRAGFGRRTSLQFHWRNHGYDSFDAFLDKLKHDERKQLKRERRRVAESGLVIETRLASELTATELERVFDLYVSISDRKWGRPYLTRAFFDVMPKERAVVVTAKDARGQIAAMTISFEKGKHIYGRHWGTAVDVPGLHFELCYYRLLDRAIANKCTLVEAGAQGEHKLKRGFLPVITHSMHKMRDPQVQAAVGAFLVEEDAAMRAEQDELLAHTPFKDGGAPESPLVAGVGDL